MKTYLLIAFTLGAVVSCDLPTVKALTSYNIEIQAKVTEFTSTSGKLCIFVNNGKVGGLSCKF